VIVRKNSLTVAGAVPALLREQRTGFPFHPFGFRRGDTWNGRHCSGWGRWGQFDAAIYMSQAATYRLG